MSKEDPELQKVRQTIENTSFALFISFSNSSSQISGAKQNNTIIELLLSLHKKLDIFLAKEKQEKLESSIENLSTKIKNLNLKENTEEKPIVKASSKGIYVWKDPREQLQEYKRSLNGLQPKASK